ncbi:MAG: immune inhibitor A [Lewinellaceae bacterium]|nr:immune inhibitor A [Phaeodactylibacter sp.]MCB9348633.1 immune inhibitor A [Lewinellaceae bacterium]
MKKLLLPLFLWVLASTLIAQPGLNYSRARISLANTSLEELAALGLETDHGQLAKGRFLINDFSEWELALLGQRGIDYEVIIPDVKAWYREQSQQPEQSLNFRGNGCDEDNGPLYDYPTPANYEYGSMGGYLTYEEMLATLDKMVDLYPNLLSARQPIGDILTHEGRPIYWLRLSDNPNEDEDEPEVLYTALHHAREPNSLSQMIFYLWYLLENYESDPEVQYLVNHTEMYFIPCINPDGYVYNEITDPFGGGLWRKNRWADEDGAVYGVDLNRNYGYEWGADDIGSSSNPEGATFRGIAPFSEPETQAVKFFCEQRQFGIALNYHTYGNLLIHPWGYNDLPTEEDAIFKGFGRLLIRENNFTMGTGSQTVGYIVNGNSDDWMYGEDETKPAVYSYTPEVGMGSVGFWPSQSMIDELNKSCLLQNLTAAHLLLNYLEAKDNSEEILTTAEGSIGLSLKKFGLMDGPVTVSVSAGSPNVAVLSAPQDYSLTLLEEDTYSFEYTLDEGISGEQEVLFAVHIDNGLYTRTDTLRKTFLQGNLETIFFDDLSAEDNWTSNFLWGLTEESFVSAPTSFTDSPNGNYPDGYEANITLQNPISLLDGQKAFLKFWARWQIESNWDYAQVLISNDGLNFIPLCGKYTKAGNGNFQPANEPLYDGSQNEWVMEEIDISEYLGFEEVYIQFRIRSDGFVNQDGFYFDDPEVVILAEPVTGASEGPGERLPFLQLYPSPFSAQFQTDFSLAERKDRVQARLLTPYGQLMAEQELREVSAIQRHRFTFEEDGLPNGVYLLQILADGELVGVRKVVKAE